MGSDFAQKIKIKNNWQIARQLKNKIDNLVKPIYDHDEVYQDNKTS